MPEQVAMSPVRSLTAMAAQLADECETPQVPDDGRPVTRTGHEDLVAGRGGQTRDGLRVPVEMLPDGKLFPAQFPDGASGGADGGSSGGETASRRPSGPCPSRAEPNRGHQPVGANHVAHGPFQLLDGLQRRTQVVDVMEKDPSSIDGRLLYLAVGTAASRWQVKRQNLHGGLAGY